MDSLASLRTIHDSHLGGQSQSGAVSPSETVIPSPTQNTVPTQMLPGREPLPASLQPLPENSPMSPTRRSPTPVVQVAASSPPAPGPPREPVRTPSRRGGFAALSRASAGPSPVKSEPSMAIDDDDGPQYRGGSSEADDVNFIKTATIKPSNFSKPGARPSSPVKIPESPAASSVFKAITSAAVYNPNSAATARASELPPHKKQKTDLDSITDYQIRPKIGRLRAIFPSASVQTCHQALVTCHGNYEDALDYLARLDAAPESDDELSLPPSAPAMPSAPAAKQNIKSHTRIQDKWASGQRPSFFGAVGSKQKPPPPPAAPRRRLIRGTKPSINHGPVKPPSPAKPHIADESDSDAQESSPEPTVDLDSKVLDFFNTCQTPDLIDIVDINEDVANLIVSHRPFSNLGRVRQIALPPEPGKKSRKPPRPIGDRVVDKCVDMWTGYEAVDALVSKCEALGKPVAREMKSWGIDIFGNKDGELELVSLGNNHNHDSGIGTPSSTTSEIPRGFIKQPSIMADNIEMKDYQIVGLNWLNLLWNQRLSCILADDMGLGKTCQVIAFLAHLRERGVSGPHLVVVPSSTLENWLREFAMFCPTLSVMPYYAGQDVRAEIRERIEEERDSIDVIVTTYTVAKAKIDAAFLRTMNFGVCVYDEGHMLKNSKSALYSQLIRIPSCFRLLLTGTPLQNNLQELASLLGFILPTVFRERKDDLEYIFSAKAKTAAADADQHQQLLSAQRIARAKSMLTPFVLRRKKHQVIDLPPKTSRVLYCDMTAEQRELYDREVDAVRQLLLDRAAAAADPTRKRKNQPSTASRTANNLMRLRQIALSPLFARRLYDDATLRKMSRACLRDPQWANSDPDTIFHELTAYNDFECHTLCKRNPKALSRFALRHDEWMVSGKITALADLLREHAAEGARTLVFSQFTMVMDLLEHVLQTLQTPFFRLDGGTSVDDRQATVDAFYDQPEVPVFLLSTRAGGAGINLACANKVVIFDAGFNPQDDVQAENRAHRVGQTRPVEVVRLVTKGTVEQQIHALGETKLALDQRVAGDEGGGSGSGGPAAAVAIRKEEEAGMQAVEGMMLEGLLKQERESGGGKGEGDAKG